LFLLPVGQAGVDPVLFQSVKVFMATFYLSQVAIGAWWFVYFTRPRVRGIFEGKAGIPAGAQLPVSITVIGWLLVSYAIGLPIPLLMKPQVPFFGLVVTGWLAVVINTAWCLAGTIAGVLLLRCRRSGWAWSVWVLALGGASLLVCHLTPGFMDRFMEAAYRDAPAVMADTPRMAIPAWLWIAAFLVMCALPLGFLFAQRQAYRMTCDANRPNRATAARQP
jgi:hypothetical protein